MNYKYSAMYPYTIQYWEKLGLTDDNLIMILHTTLNIIYLKNTTSGYIHGFTIDPIESEVIDERGKPLRSILKRVYLYHYRFTPKGKWKYVDCVEVQGGYKEAFDWVKNKYNKKGDYYAEIQNREKGFRRNIETDNTTDNS